MTRPTPDNTSAINADVGATPSTSLRRAPRFRPLVRPELPLPLQVWDLAKWVLLEQFMAFSVGFVDTALAGHLPDPDAANAISVATYVTWLMGLLQGALGVGALALIARAIGARHRRQANAAVGQAMLLAILFGLIITLVFLAIAPLVGPAVNLTQRPAALAATYLQIHASAALFMSILFVGSACLRGAGDFRSPFRVMVLVNTVNVIVSVTLVAAPAPIGGHGLAGIAAGTAAAWFVGGLAMWLRLITGNGGIKLLLHRLKPHRATANRILRVSLPNLAENVLFWVGHFAVVWVVANLPGQPNALGAHIFAIRIEALSFLPGYAFGQAAGPLVGQYLGARDPLTARRAAWTCWAFAVLVMSALGLAFVLAPEAFVRLLTNREEFIAPAAMAVFIVGFAQPGFATAMALSGALRGAGDTRMSMIIGLVSMYLVRLPLVWILGITLGFGLTGVWIALSLELVLRALLYLARFLHGGWMHIKV